MEGVRGADARSLPRGTGGGGELRILFTYHHPLSDPSFRHRWLPLIERLNPEEYSFDIICTKNDLELKQRNINVILERANQPLPLYLSRTITAPAKEHYDIVHALKPGTSFATYMGSVLGKTRFILDVDDYDWSSNVAYSFSAKFLLNSHFDYLITASKRLNQRFGGKYLPNSASLTRFDPDSNEKEASKIKEEYGLNKEKIIFWAGKFVPEVNTEFLVELGEYLEETVLLVAGDGPAFGPFKKQAANVESILTLGWVENQEMPAFYTLADAGLIPFPDTEYHRCKCPIKLFEYMASELPVLSTPVGEPKHVIQRAGCGITRNSPREIAEAFKNISKQELKRKGKRGRRYLEFNQNYEILKGELDCIYKDVVSK